MGETDNTLITGYHPRRRDTTIISDLSKTLEQPRIFVEFEHVNLPFIKRIRELNAVVLIDFSNPRIEYGTSIGRHQLSKYNGIMDAFYRQRTYITKIERFGGSVIPIFTTVTISDPDTAETDTQSGLEAYESTKTTYFGKSYLGILLRDPSTIPSVAQYADMFKGFKGKIMIHLDFDTMPLQHNYIQDLVDIAKSLDAIVNPGNTLFVALGIRGVHWLAAEHTHYLPTSQGGGTYIPKIFVTELLKPAPYTALRSLYNLHLLQLNNREQTLLKELENTYMHNKKPKYKNDEELTHAKANVCKKLKVWHLENIQHWAELKDAKDRMLEHIQEVLERYSGKEILRYRKYAIHYQHLKEWQKVLEEL